MKTILIAVLLSLAFTACKKSATNKNTTVSYQLKSKNASYSIASRSGTSLSWTSGYAYVTEIKFEAEGECQIEGQSDLHKKFGVTAPQKVDLFAPLLSLGDLQVPACDYKNSKFEIALTPASGNAALELKGTFDNKPIIFRINSAVELDGIGGNKSLVGGTNYTALTSLNLSLLTDGITADQLKAATIDNTGTRVISSTSNTSLYQKMLSNFQNISEEEFH
ncbi:MAG: hypothetical protein NVS3B19_09900 [Ginsengibacter sp.]